MDDEIATLEKEYLAKIAKLLVMTQVHCEIKTDIYNEFNRLNLSSNVKEINPNEASFNGQENKNNNL